MPDGKKTIIAAMVVLVAVCGGIATLLLRQDAAKPHAVTIRWNPPGAGSKPVRYNVYRGTTNGGPYTRIGSANEPKYVDTLVVSGQTYYYVTTSVDKGGQESRYSGEISARIP